MAETGTQNITEVTEASSIATGDNIYLNHSNQLQQIDYDKLATAILNKLSTQSFSSLETTAKTVLGGINELNSKSYLLQGGTIIPNNADMNNYTTPGNYYCISDSAAKTLKNCPFTHAFTLKVEYSRGNSVPCQTFREYNTGITAYRKYESSTWIDYYYFSDDATVLGQTITYSSHTIPANRTMTIEEGGNTFYQLVILRGTMASGYNAILLTGYSPGTNTRYFYKVLDNGDAVDISISNTSFVMTNKSSNNSLNARIFRLYGNAPTVSVS